MSIATSEAVALTVPRPRWARFTLLWLVFSSGVAVMGLEMTASQLIKPFFGSTISVWTSLIGLVMIFLTAGYYLGGAWADRHPSRGALGGIVLAAGVITMVIPLVSAPVLKQAWALTPKAGLLVGSLVGTFALFSLPMVLLGCVCPFAMKLSIQDLGRTGRAAGNVYAVSAVGSVVGTFLPALVMIERFGVRHSIMLFGALLMVAALLLLGRLRFAPAAGAMALLAVPLAPMLPVQGMIAERESPYNYLQVVEVGQQPPTRLLIVDWGAFSFYTPGEFRTGQYYDYLLLAPLMRAEPPTRWLRRVLVIGLGAGTIAKQITQAYGPVEIDGVEIDPAIISLGRKYFDMDEPNLRVHATDGRAFLASAQEPYDWVIVDAYQGSDIPSHLITQEFFQQVKAHLSPGGVLSINVAWWEPKEEELIRRMTTSVGTAFPSVFAITGISQQSGAVMLAGSQPVTPKELLARAGRVGHPGLTEIAAEMGDDQPPLLTSPEPLGPPLTDDQGIVSDIVDRMYRQMRKEAYQREQAVLGR